MREIILDTETTGLDPVNGDRIVEIGCLETLNGIATGQTFHAYLNPEREMTDAAFDVHGLSQAFLSDKPVFRVVVDDLLAFIGDARLVIHNAEFDVQFLNAELQRVGRPPIAMDRVVDTLLMARRKHPGASNSLDALCQRYRIDNSMRNRHGALLDAEILAEVYAELSGGRQAAMILDSKITVARRSAAVIYQARATQLPPRLTQKAAASHASFVAELGDKALWLLYLIASEATPAQS
jgi:DNA polymerase III subunit epsilon